MPLDSKISFQDRESMRLLSRFLKYRVTIQALSKGVSEADTPGYYTTAAPITEEYTDLKTVWGYIIPKKADTDFIQAIRGEQNLNRITHEIWVRWESVRSFGVAFSSAFDTAFDSIRDINPIKNEYFLFIQSGGAFRGRRFQVVETRWDERNHEYLRIRCREQEEIGTGYPV